MDKKSDILIRKMIKNWVSKQHPPENGRARLLWEAAQSSRNKIELSEPFYRPHYGPYSLSSTSDWPQTLLTWINEYSLHLRIQPRLI